MLTSLIAIPRDWTQKLVTVQALVWALGKVACAVAVAFFYFGVEVLSEYQDVATPKLELALESSPEQPSSKAPLDQYSIITRRNIFGAVKKVNNQPVTPENKTPPTELRLAGTHFSADGEKIAIIENVKKGEQDIFSEQDSVFEDGTKLIEIGENSVKVDQNGQIKILELDDGSAAGDSKDGAEDGSGESFSVAESELNSALANLPELLSQARAVPYFRNGESIGMRLFAIRKGSLYEKLGLKNGDIVKSVNDNNIGDPTQALKLFEQLKSERRIKVVTERAGEDKTLSYSID